MERLIHGAEQRLDRLALLQRGQPQGELGDTDQATGVYASTLGRLAIRDAVRERRTFATGDDTASIKMMADGACWMGSMLKGLGKTVVTVELRDKEPADGFGKVELYGPDKQVLASKGCLGENPCEVSFPLEIQKKTFVVALGVQKDGGRLVSAPIWFEP